MSNEQTNKHSSKEVQELVDKFIKTASDVHGDAYAFGYISSMLTSLIRYANEFEHNLAFKQLERQISYLHEVSHDRLMRERKAA